MAIGERSFLAAVVQAVPDSKDIERAEKILEDCPGDYMNPAVFDTRMKKASTQLRRITDRDKFKRRLKAFIDHGIMVDLTGCQVFQEYATTGMSNSLNKLAASIAETFNDKIDYNVELVL